MLHITRKVSDISIELKPFFPIGLWDDFSVIGVKGDMDNISKNIKLNRFIIMV